MEEWDDVMVAEWRRRSSFVGFLKCLARLLLLNCQDFYKGMSATFICFLLAVKLAEGHYAIKTWRRLDHILSHMLVIMMGNNYAIYSLMYPNIHRIVPQRERISLTLSSFSTVLAAKLPYILAYVDPELRPSFFNVRGLVSFVICFLTELDILLFHWCPGPRGPSLRLELHPQLRCQSCLRFLVFVGLIVFGGANMIVKAWHGALDFHKHVLFLLILCALSYIRFREKYRRMLKKLMTVVPIDEKED